MLVAARVGDNSRQLLTGGAVNITRPSTYYGVTTEFAGAAEGGYILVSQYFYVNVGCEQA
jgi:hypothetical protein